MKKATIIVFVALIIHSCQKIECPGFDFNHAINKWNWFPGNEQEYEFVNVDSSIISLTRTRYDFNPYEERSCHSCACFSDLNTHYEFMSLGIQLRNHLSFQSDKNSDEGSLYFGVDNIGSPFDPEHETVTEVEVPGYETREFNVTLMDSVTLNYSSHLTVTQLEIMDTTKSKVRKLWLVADQGIVGLDIAGEIWERK